MAVMVNSYKAQSILRGVPSCRRIAARDLGGRGAEQGTLPAENRGHRLIHVFSLASPPFPLPMHLKPGADALAAGSLAEIGHSGGNLEGAIELLLGTERIMRDRVVAEAGQSRAELCPGWKNIEPDRPFVAEHLAGCWRGARRQCHQWHVSRPRGRLAERFGDRVGVLQGDGEAVAKGYPDCIAACSGCELCPVIRCRAHVSARGHSGCSAGT